jgi:hypothetical protein
MGQIVPAGEPRQLPATVLTGAVSVPDYRPRRDPVSGVVLVIAVVLLGAGRALTRLGGGAVSVAGPSVIRGLF